MRFKKWNLNKFHIGARTLKTGLSIVLSIYCANWLNNNSILAAIGAIVVMQPTVYRTFLSLLQQIIANLFGALIAIALSILLGKNPIWIGIGSILTIWFATITKTKQHVGITLVTMIIIMEATTDNFIDFSITRITSLLTGIIISFLINVFILPPKYEDKLYKHIKIHYQDVAFLLEHILDAEKCRDLPKSLFEKVAKKKLEVETLYHLFKDERKFYKKREMSKARKLVLYRAMMTSIETASDVVRKLQTVEDSLHILPDDFQKKFFTQLAILSNEHKEIFNSFLLKPNAPKIFNKTHITELLKLLGALKNFQTHDRLILLKINTLITSLFEYGESIKRLQSLLNSQTYIH